MDPGALVERSIVWPGARVEAGATVTECIVAGPVVVRAGARYNRVVIVPAEAGTPSALAGDGHVAVTPIEGKGSRT